jgi:DNA invertase Pin-like site-specific DNA recombinase
MIDRIEQGEASGIIAWHPDRLARNSIDGGKIIYLVDTGKISSLAFPTYRFDTSAQGKFMLSIIFGQSKYYVDSLSENTKRGLREKVRLGVYPSFAPIGYANDRGKIAVDEATAPLVRKLYALCAEGKYNLLELRKLATAFGLVSKRKKKPLSYSNVHRILTNPFYYGLFEYKGEIFPGTHTPIIEKDLFDKVQEIIRFRSKPIINKNQYFAFRGFLRCAECGCQITAEMQKGHVYYRCTKKRGPCAQSKYLREENLAHQIKEAIVKMALGEGLFSPMMKELEREKTLQEADRIFARRNGEIKLGEINDKLKTLLDVFMDNTISVEEYREKKAQLLNQKVELEKSPETHDGKWLEQMKSFLTLAHQATSIAAEANYEAQRDFLRNCGSNLCLNNGTLVTTYRYPWRYIVENRENQKWGHSFHKLEIIPESIISKFFLPT